MASKTRHEEARHAQDMADLHRETWYLFKVPAESAMRDYGIAFISFSEGEVEQGMNGLVPLAKFRPTVSA